MGERSNHNDNSNMIIERITASTSSSSLVRARSSTLHCANVATTSKTALRSSAVLNHAENEMSSSMHITKTSTLLNSPDESIHAKQKSSPWFWRRRNVSRTSLVRSASTNKANEAGASVDGGWANDRPSADEAYESKTSTLSSAVTVESSALTTSGNQIVSRSASTRDSKPPGGFLVMRHHPTYLNLTTQLRV